MTTKEVLSLADECIAKWGIVDEDEKQEIYLHALAAPDLQYQNVKKAINTAFKKILSTRKKDSLLFRVATIPCVRISVEDIKVYESDCYKNLLKLLETLEVVERAIIKMRYFNDYSVSDISSITYLPQDEVVAIENRAINKLRSSPFLDIIKDYYPTIIG